MSGTVARRFVNQLELMTWREVSAVSRALDKRLALVLGATEQHGHTPRLATTR